MKNRLNVAVIGLGIGEQHARTYASHDRCKLVALCDTDKEQLARVANNFPLCKPMTDPAAIIDNPQIDLVSIASFDNFHASQVLQCIKHGKHIFVEKPLCLFDTEFAEISKALKNNPKIKLSSNLVLRTYPHFKIVKDKIESGEFGKIYHIEGDYNYGRLNKITEGWRGQIPFYSVSHGGGIHLIDLMMWLTKGKITEVTSIGNQICSVGSQFKHYDMVTALLKFEQEFTGKVSSNFGSVTPHHHAIRIFGTKASYSIGLQGENYCFSRDSEVSSNSIELLDHMSIKVKTDKSQILKSFINYILDGSPAEVSQNEVIGSMAVSLAIERSLKSKKWEKI